ncbi:STT3 domain-containing protein [Candidatus Nanohalococcus occultus]|uniref:dolichyl-phosphooligosaccharide-protein glycotransferase n=1 Tax=Candidatus Nanohalococcus occultus TaxID=2978047 RepID=A0ABY8CJ86_9ARCH|nr:Dolichyl-phosphooligosaccharide-protein glycotransferase [Candidatus Nanohaloarchaeota archaeon SVXNc]
MDAAGKLDFDFEQLDFKEILKTNWAFVAAGAIAMLGFWLRFSPAQGMQYLQALDPYMIFRLSQHLALEGTFPQLDFLRYFPYAAPTYTLNQGDILIPAVLYQFGPSMFMSYLEWGKMYPAIMGGLGVFASFLFAREVWDDYAGVFSAFFLATVAGAMHRTSAGFFEKEPLGTFLMLMSMYFFVRCWKRKEKFTGIFSGVMLGLFTISWGGSKMLWLLYPMVVGVVALMDRDIEQLIMAYTPTVLVGAGLAAALNPSRFWFTSTFFLVNLGMLGLVWTRFLAEELQLVEKEQLSYLVPSISVLGGVLLLASPLYSKFLGSKVMGLIGTVTVSNSGTDVIAGTVAENQGATLSQIIGQLGALPAAQINTGLGLLGHLVGPWTLSFIGTAMLGTIFALMVGKRFNVLDDSEIQLLSYYKLLASIFLLWIISFSIFFKESIFLAVVPATLVFIVAATLNYAWNEMEGTFKIPENWYVILPFFWVITNVLAAVTRSRLVFLSTFSVAVVGGYAASKAFKGLKELDYSKIDPENAKELKAGLLAAIVGAIMLVNGASGFAAAQGISGSPNSAWMDNLDWMENETPEGSVILSWWDYGYYFESIGRRAAAADGGNQKYYSDEVFGKTNYPIADFLTGTDPMNHTDLLERHSIDYIVLDSRMLGKYGAVSQIANRDNSEFSAMRMASTNNVRPGLGNGSAAFTAQLPRTAVYAELESSGNSISFENPPIVESVYGRGRVDCTLTEENGITRFDTPSNQTAKLPKVWFDRPAEQREVVEVCAAEHPYYSFERGMSGGTAQIVLVPKNIVESNLVDLYLMNGQGIDYVEPVPEGSNGYVRAWEVDLEGQ